MNDDLLSKPRVLEPTLPEGKARIEGILLITIADVTENKKNTTVDTDTNSTVNIAPVNITISAPPEVFNVSNDDEVGYVLTFYSTPSLFQVKAPEGVNKSDFEFVADSAVVGLTINRNSTELTGLTEPVIITLQSLRALGGEVCMCIVILKLGLCYNKFA